MHDYRLPALPRKALTSQFTWRVPPHFNIASATIGRHAQQTPHNLALIDAEQRYTFAQIQEQSNRLANALQAQGVTTGERVGVWLRPSLGCALVHLALYKLGAIALPLSSLFGRDALLYRLEHSQARWLVCESGLYEQHTTVLSNLTILLEDALPSLMAQASPHFNPAPTLAAQPAVLLYTSGTTGQPKGALLPHQALLGHLPGFYLFANQPSTGAVFWSPADWAWIGGLFNTLLCPWFYGLTVVASRRQGFDPHEALHLMQKHHVSHSFLFPTALKRLRGLGNIAKPPSLQNLHSAGEPLGSELLQWVQEGWGLQVNEFYGQTEMNLLVGNNRFDPVRAGSMGLPYPGHRIVLLDENGHLVPNGQMGEIALETPNPVTFLGYWRNPQATQTKFAGPYLRSGDIAVRDEDGYLWFKARSDDLIKAAGYRISPFEVEDALLKHPQVAMVAVLGQPDPERGQRVVAYVKLHQGQGSEQLVRDLQAEVRQRVGHHAYPREVHFVEELPLTTTGKIQRFQLRQKSSGI